MTRTQPNEAPEVTAPTINEIREKANNTLLPDEYVLELLNDELQQDTLATIRDDIADGVESVAGYTECWHIEGGVAHYPIMDTGVWFDDIESALRDDPATADIDDSALRDIATTILTVALRATGPTDHSRPTARYTGPTRTVV